MYQLVLKATSGRLLFLIASLSSLLVFIPAGSADQIKGTLSPEIDNFLSEARYQEALSPLMQALDQARQDQDTNQEALALHHLGVAYLGLNEQEPAALHLKQAIALAEETKSNVLRSSALNNLGTLYRRQPGNIEAARKAYLEAISLAEAEERPDLALEALSNLASFEIDQNQAETAKSLLVRANNHLDTLPGQAGKTKDILLIGRLLARAQAIEPAYAMLSDARARAQEEANPRLEALATGYLADLYEQSDRDQEALTLFDQATFLAQAAEAPDLAYRWQRQAGALAVKSGDIDRAIERYRASVTVLDQLRPTLISAPRSTSTQTDLRTVYVELADLLLKRAAANPAKAVQQRDLEEARLTIERYRSTELTDYFRDECVTDLLARVEPVDQLAPRTAVLYPIVMADRLAILLSLPDGLQQHSIEISADALTDQLLEFRRLLQKRTTNQYLRPAQELYNVLLRPLEPSLSAADVDTLIMVPDEALRLVPLGALHDGEQFVIDRYAQAIVPSLQLIEPRSVTTVNLEPLLAGLSEPVQGFTPLPHVDNELAEISNLLGGDTLSNQAFITGQIERSLGRTPYSVVHIASHAQFTGDSKESFILTYDDKLDMDRLERFIKLSRFREEPVEILTLSACQTAEGDDRAALGLAGLAVKSGARSALASLWHINDRASSLLIANFYRNLQKNQPGFSKAAALRQAQIDTKTDLRFRHPAYWAPFILIGNWL